MKDLHLLTWLTQLGLSVALPLIGFVWLAVWLNQTHGWGGWIIAVGIGLGLICAMNGLRVSLKAISQTAKSDTEKKPPAAFNDHD